jgi:hypothetical protein
MPKEQDYYRRRKSALEQIENEKWVPGLQTARFRVRYCLVHHTLHLLLAPTARSDTKYIDTLFDSWRKEVY